MSPDYRTQSPDTAPEIEALLVAAWRRMTPAEKVERAFALRAATHEVARAGIRMQHPGATAEVVETLLAVRVLGPALAHEVQLARAARPLST